MLENRPICENCGKSLPYDSKDAMICNFECTFCTECADKLGYTCPNCEGELMARPIMNQKYLEDYPPSSEKIFRPISAEKWKELQGLNLADIHTLFRSDFYEVVDFQCRCKTCGTSKPEFNGCFSLGFVRKGYFEFNTFRQKHEAFSGKVLIDKPGIEYTVTHTIPRPDECTVINFTSDFYHEMEDNFDLKRSWFFSHPDIHSLLLKVGPEVEYLHNQLLTRIADKEYSKLEMDNLVMEILHLVMAGLDASQGARNHPETYQRNHLITIERAKEYLNTHFDDDISLHQLSQYCYVSAFHFSRIFKEFTDLPPHRYLQDLRLKHAETLLKAGQLPVAEVGLRSGFNSLAYFSSAFSKKYKVPPTKFKEQYQ